MVAKLYDSSGAPIFLKSNLISQVPYIQLMYSVSLVNA